MNQRADTYERHAAADLVNALTSAGFKATRDPSRVYDVAVEVDGRRIHVDAKYTAYATAERVRSLLGYKAAPDAVRALVADRVTADARELLNAAGWSWFDRRGHLRLRAPGVLIDTDIAPQAALKASREGIIGRSGVAVAYWLCHNPERTPSPTKDGAAALRMAPSSVTLAMQHLLKGGLVGERGGLFPELFWELATRWKPTTTWLAEAPDLDADRSTAGWRVVGNLAAAMKGAPLVTRREGPTEFYVPGPIDADIAVRRYGAAQPGAGAAVLRVAPLDAAREWPGEPNAPTMKLWRSSVPIVPTLTLALDIAQDAGRGKQILEEWMAPERVW